MYVTNDIATTSGTFEDIQQQGIAPQLQPEVDSGACIREDINKQGEIQLQPTRKKGVWLNADINDLDEAGQVRPPRPNGVWHNADMRVNATGTLDSVITTVAVTESL